MSVSFSTNSTVLSQWGFSAGDIAAMAGAGRAVGTWVMAQARDRNLLDFMRVDVNDVNIRRGLIDRFALHERWGTKLVLLQNDRKRVIRPPGQKAIEDLDSFTWLMALIVASLDSGVALKSLRKIMKEFLTMLFGDHEDGLDYLLHELPRHIEGWLSIATVRTITARARQEWKYLADRGFHEPGLIPDDDVGEISRLLAWIAASRERIYETSSGDAFSIAVILQAIGLELISTNQGVEEHDENRLVIKLLKAPIGKIPTKPYWQLGERWGMRVPLQFMQECVSLWPGTAAENNERRRVFEDGMNAAKGLSLVASQPRPGIRKDSVLLYVLRLDNKSQQAGRVDGVVHRLARGIFPVTTSAIAQGLQPLADKLNERWSSEQFKKTEDPLFKDTEDPLQHIGADPPMLAELQSFVMGFYYRLLIPLLDTSQLSVPQAFGSWGWYDLNLLYKISRTLEETCVGPSQFLKHGVMRLLALFFGGIEEEQLQLIDDGVVGVLGKLSLLTASLLGDIDTWEKASKFFLIDVDPSCIPCTSRGIVTSTRRHEGLARMVTDSNKGTRACQLAEVDLSGGSIDFTSHIEPDWEFDIQLCRLAFRYKGRLMRHFGPLDCDYAVLEDSPLADTAESQEQLYTKSSGNNDKSAKQPLDKVLIPHSIHDWTNKFVIGPILTNKDHDWNRPPTLIATKGRSRARTCFRTWYWRNGFHALPCPSPYSHVPQLKDSKVLCYDDSKWMSAKEGRQQPNLEALYSRGRHLILA